MDDKNRTTNDLPAQGPKYLKEEYSGESNSAKDLSSTDNPHSDIYQSVYAQPDATQIQQMQSHTPAINVPEEKATIQPISQGEQPAFTAQPAYTPPPAAPAYKPVQVGIPQTGKHVPPLASDAQPEPVKKYARSGIYRSTNNLLLRIIGRLLNCIGCLLFIFSLIIIGLAIWINF